GKGASYIAPVIQPDPSTNSVIVRAPPSELTAIQRMVAELDKQMLNEPPTVRTIALPSDCNAIDMAKMIEKSLNESEAAQRERNRDYQVDRVSIQADIRSNSLVVSASKAKYADIQRLVDELVKARPGGGGGIGVSFIPIKNMKPEDAKKLIEDMQQKQRGG